MKTKIIITLFVALLATADAVWADSPLTSTVFSKAFNREPIVELASEANGVLNEELASYLMDKNNPVALKVALINALGWDINGKNNAAIFMEYLIKNGKYRNERNVLRRADGSVLISLAYLKAMDNYFHVDEAITIADSASSKSKKSYTVHMITALIKAQKAMETDWCKVYNLVNDVTLATSLEHDFDEDAITIIFDYIRGYADAC